MAKHILVSLLLLWGSMAGAVPASASPENDPADADGQRVILGPLATRGVRKGPVDLRIDAPVVRIGLSAERTSLTLSSSGDYFIVDPGTGRNLWASRHSAPVHVVLQLRGGEPTSRFRVQVASLSSEAPAEALRERVERETGEAAIVSHDPDRGVYRIRVGAASSRDGISPVEEKLRAMGFAETWIVEESVGRPGRLRLRLVDEDYESVVIEPEPFLVLPSAPGRPIRLNGKPYRGAIEVRVVDGSRLRAINVINLEEYLRGVVPLELGPSIYPEPEALKAQAVAARTYVVANRGQFAAEGFDICDTPRCQVYGGIDGEDSMSDNAVETTSGQILTRDGRPINALYTATCGGHTEDVVNVFREESEEAAYLKGVPCYAEEGVLDAWRRVLRGRPPPPPSVDPSGGRIDDALAVLGVRRVLDGIDVSARNLAAVATTTEIATVVTRVLALAGKTNGQAPMAAGAYPSTVAFSEYLIGALGWSERVKLLLDRRDLPSLLGGDRIRGGVDHGLAEAAYLMREGILPPRLGDGEDLLAPVTRSLLVRAAYRILAGYDALELTDAIFRGSRQEAVIVVPDEAELAGLASSVEILVPADAVLARDDGTQVDLVPELTLVPGDRILYHLREGKAVYIRQRANVRGASDDRFTVHFQWQVRMTREELESKVGRRSSIGRLVDLVPLERGVSGRVTALQIVGSRGRFTFRGFGIRSLLGLKETLFVVDRQRAPDGTVETFIFTGKGWGHGVGLCQVGAFGMALRGASYREILDRYYTGVEVEPFTWE